MVEAPMQTKRLQNLVDDAAPLNSVRLPGALFGGKAEQIALSSSLGLRIPAGYAIPSSMVEEIVRASEADRVTTVGAIFEELAALSPTGAVVVRSSHFEEDGQAMRSSGLYKSVSGNQSTHAVLEAIDAVVADALKREDGIGRPLPVILQSEIPAESSAVVLNTGAHARVELFRGALCGPIQGEREPTVVIVTKEASGEPRSRILSDSEGFGEVAATLARSLFKHLPPHDRETLYEAGHDGRDWHFFQRQEICLNPSALSNEWGGIGRKASAMQTFKKLGVFSKRLEIFHPGEDVDVSGSRWRYPMTVRFSCDEMLGLPRAFVENSAELETFIARRSEGWATIVHDFIDVVRSFELLIDEERAYLEHVPGLWESESTLQPDALVIESDGRCSGFAVRGSRECRNGTRLGDAGYRVAPIERDELEGWAARISELLPALRAEFADQLPANFHFVEDAAGNWNFLNCRPSHNPPALATFDENGSHVVEKDADLDCWDGQSPIVLRLRTRRGGEGTLVPLAKRLAKLEVPIQAQFGYLSHPAMVLLAHGVKLVPSCFGHSRLGAGSTRRFDFALDHGSDPLARILTESPVLLDEHIRVVHDRAPIVPDHLLVLSTERLRGFADRPSVGAAALLAVQAESDRQSGRFRDWFIYERGRASFCTSGFTDAHAHMHILPLADFEERSIETLADAIGAIAYANLEAAWREVASESGEYLVFGSREGAAYLKRGGSALFGKRFVRRFLEERRVQL